MSPSINLETTYYIKTDNFLLKASGSIENLKDIKKFIILRKRWIMSNNCQICQKMKNLQKVIFQLNKISQNPK